MFESKSKVGVFLGKPKLSTNNLNKPHLTHMSLSGNTVDE